MKKYYNSMWEGYYIPVTECTPEIVSEIIEFLEQNTDYFLTYLSVDSGYTENMWCITNWYLY